MSNKRRKILETKPPDMFMLSYASLVTLLLAFFIVINTFTEEKKKEFIKEFQRSFNRSAVTFGLGGILPGGNPEEGEDIKSQKYIYSDKKNGSNEEKGIDLIDQDEDQVPAAVVVYFDENDTVLSTEGKYFLNNLISLIGDRPCSLIIEGHTRKNFKSSRLYNNSWKLSLERAKVVADYIHIEGNISSKRMITIGYGNNKPLSKNKKGDKYNDRVSIIINVMQ